jgi:hypothetical protein
MTDLLVVAVVLLLMALYLPLYGALLALFIVWHSNRHALIARRNIAIAGSALAIFNLLVPITLP